MYNHVLVFITTIYNNNTCKFWAIFSYFSSALNFCSSAIGVALGYIVGGQTLSYYVDINKVNPNSWVYKFDFDLWNWENSL